MPPGAESCMFRARRPIPQLGSHELTLRPYFADKLWLGDRETRQRYPRQCHGSAKGVR